MFTCYLTVIGSTQTSELTISKSRLGGYDFDWAMLVMETIMPASKYCDDYPASDSLTFTNVALDGSTVDWTTRV